MRFRFIALAPIAAAIWASSCKPSSQCTDNNGNLASVGGPVIGDVDNHCYLAPPSYTTAPGGPIAAQVTDQSSCPADAGLYPDGGPPASELPCGFYPDGGPAGCTPVCDADGGPPGCDPEYGPTNYNSSANDDDCKYQTAWWSTPIVKNGSTTLYFTALHTVDGTPATGANVYAEVFLPSENHISPSTNPPVSEGPDGVYTIGPVIFDRSGLWTVRYHLHENCADLLPDSPHGHAAFYVNVP